MANPVSVGQITIKDNNDLPLFGFTKDPIFIKVTEASASGIFDSTTSTTVSLWLGNYNDTNNWTFNVTKSNVVCSEATSATTQTVTSMSASAGSITFSATKVGYGTISHTVDVIKLAGANSVIDARLARQSSSINADSSGVVSAPALLNTGNEVRVYSGIVPLDYDGFGVTDGHFKVTLDPNYITPGTITSVPDSGSNVFTETTFESGTYYQGQTVNFAKVSDIQAFDPAQNSGTLRFIVEGKDFYGNSFQLAKVQTFNKNKEAATTPVYELSASSSSVIRLKNGTLEPYAINFYAYKTDGLNVKTTYNGRFILSSTLSGNVPGAIYNWKYTSSSNESFCQFSNIPSGANTIKCELYQADGTSILLDTMTIPVLVEGSDGISASLSNESHNIPADAEGKNGNFAGCTSTMTVYVGSVNESALWSFSSSAYNLTYASSDGGRTVTVSTGGMANNVSLGYIDIWAIKGTSFVTKRFTVTKSKDGGALGSLGIANSSVVFKKSSSGTITPTSVDLTLNTSNFTGASYQWKRDGVNTVTTPTCTVYNTDFTSSTSRTYSVTITGTVNGVPNQTLSDTIIIPRLDDGDPAITVVLSNDSIPLQGPNTGYSGVVYIGASCDVTVYRGSDQLVYGASGANTFSCTNSSSGITVAGGSFVGNIYTVPVPTGTMTSDNAYTDVFITVRDKDGVNLPVITKRISYSISRTGIGGGYSCIVYAYQRATSLPTLKPNDVTVTFSTGTITYPAVDDLGNSWKKVIPSGTDSLYITAATAAGTGTTATILGGQFSSPVLFSQNGSAGTGGLNVATVSLYQRTATSTPPAAINSTPNYVYSTFNVTNISPSAWLTSIPSTGGSYLWITRATASSTSSNDDLPMGEWSAPALFSQNGIDSRSYKLNADTVSITNKAGIFTPSTVTFTSTSQLGNSGYSNYPVWFKIKCNGSLTYQSASAESIKSISPSANTATIRAEIYETGSFGTMLDFQDVEVKIDTTQAILNAFNAGGKEYIQTTDPFPFHPIFSRASVASRDNGTTVIANYPRMERGRYNQAIRLEEGTTNLLPSSILQVYNNTAVNTPCVFSVLSETYNNQPIYRTVFTATNASAVGTISDANIYDVGVVTNTATTWTANTDYTASIFWRCSTPGLQVNGEATNVPGWHQHSTESVGNGWNRSHSHKYHTATQDDQKYWAFRDVNCVVGQVYIIDWTCPQVEQKAYLTSYTPSVRSDELISIPTSGILYPTQGTVEFWHYFTPKDYGNKNRGLFSLGGGWATSDRTAILIDTSDNIQFQMQFGATSTGNSVVTSYAITGGWHHLAMTWSGSTLSGYVDGALIGTKTLTKVHTFFQSYCYLGIAGDVSYSLGLYDDLRISNIARTASEIASTYLSLTSTVRDQYTTLLLPFDANDVWTNGTSQYIYNGIAWELASTIGAPTGTYVGTQKAEDVSYVIGNSDGRGINIAHPNYSSFEQSGLPIGTQVKPGGTAVIDQTVHSFSSDTRSLLITATGGNDTWVYLSTASTGHNIRIQPNKKWLFSAYVMSDASSVSGELWVNTVLNGFSTYSLSFLTSPTINTWTRVCGIIDLTADNSTACFLRLDNNANTNVKMWFDSIMFEEKISNNTGVNLPSVYSEPVIPDIADRVNYGYTFIDGSKITISAGTYLSDWRKGGDLTSIDGGKISTNTIEANKITIGNRNVSIKGIQFSGVGGVCSWTSGVISYFDDSNVAISANISSGSKTWSSGIDYIYWTKGGTTLQTSNALSAAMTQSTIILATYAGGIDLVNNYGRTVIDGSNINTGTIDANKIIANTITSREILSSSISGDRIVAGTIDATRIKTGSLTSDVLSAGSITSTQIAAGAITTDKLTVNTKELAVEGLVFSTSGNWVSWTACKVYSGTITGIPVSGTINFVTLPLYIYWDSGSANVLSSSTTRPTAETTKILAIYRGWDNVDVQFGETIITGNRIQTGSITANNISGGTITAAQIKAGTITSTEIATGTITADRIASNSITTDQISIGVRTTIADHFNDTPTTNKYIVQNVSGGSISFALNPNNGIIGRGTVSFQLA